MVNCDQIFNAISGVQVTEEAPALTISDWFSPNSITRLREEDPDYETLYRSMAECWAFSANRAYQEVVVMMDVHAPDKLRGNRVLQTLDQFYETFDIQPGDGMWVEPEARVSIW